MEVYNRKRKSEYYVTQVKDMYGGARTQVR